MKLQMNVSPKEAIVLLGALTQIDQIQVKQAVAERQSPMAVLHGLQTGAVRYRLADPDEHWQTRKEVLRAGSGDCEDLAAAIAAELNETVYAGGVMPGAQFGAMPPLPPPPGPVQDPWPAFGTCTPSFGAVAERAVPVAYKAKPNLFHVVVWAPGWGYLDPSVAGGMGSNFGASGQARTRWLQRMREQGPRRWRTQA